MEFLAYHGCLASEKENGGSFVVDFRASVDLGAAAQSDELADTLDYSAVYKIVAAEMATPSDLLENVAGRIRAAIEEAYPALPEFEISVSKKNPPVGGNAAVAKVTLYGGCAR
ncbi:MAG: dihydroneopterin aldolase [Bacteroidales bacterium]|nr:dihydroneopterin aldolase [Bacteroidales bacterium]